MNLTKKAIDGLSWQADGPAQQITYDDALPGFGVRVYGTGAKTFVLKYRTREGRRSRLHTIGRYGVLTPDQARERARRLLVGVLDGADPVADAKSSRKAATLAEFADEYLERHAKRRKKSWRADERRLRRHVLPALGSLQLIAVRKADVARLHTRIGDAHPYEANRVLALISGLFSKAEEWGAVPAAHPNPARGVEAFAERSRDRFVTEQELPLLMEAIEAEPSPHARAALLLYLLTGLRRSELLQLRWDHVNLEQRQLRLPDTKAGRPHVVPLSSAAMEVLRGIPRLLGNPFVIASPVKHGAPWADLKSAWRRVRARVSIASWVAANPEQAATLRSQVLRDANGDSELGEKRFLKLALVKAQHAGGEAFDVRLHDLRRTVGSWLAMRGASLPLIGRVLNHSNASTTQVYARFTDDPAREALERHAERINAVRGGGATA